MSTLNVSRYRFLDTHLRLSNTFAFHALALDEHRASFEPALWTRTIAHDAKDAPSGRSLEAVEQRWFVGAHANVGGGYPSDPLAQVTLKWLMEKAVAYGLKFKSFADSYGNFMYGAYRFVSKPYYRPIGGPPHVGTEFTTSTINESIDASVFDRRRTDPEYRPPNLKEWAQRVHIDPAAQTQSVLANDPTIAAPEPEPFQSSGVAPPPASGDGSVIK